MREFEESAPTCGRKRGFRLGDLLFNPAGVWAGMEERFLSLINKHEQLDV